MRAWTQEERDYMIANYHSDNIKECAEYLGRTERSVVIFACRNGLSRKNKITPEYAQYIRENYGKMNSKEISEATGLDRNSIKYWARYHGIAYGGFWTPKEIDYLQDKFGTKTEKAIAKKLGRSENAVKQKINELGLGGYAYNSDFLTATEVANILGLHKSTICSYAKNNMIKSMRRKGYVFIHETDLVKFMQDNPEKWKAINCDYYSFCRYEWFMKRLNDEKKAIREKYWKGYEQFVIATKVQKKDGVIKVVGNKKEQ